MHQNEVDFRYSGKVEDATAQIDRITKYTLEAAKLGKNYTAALAEQLRRQGVVIPPKEEK